MQADHGWGVGLHRSLKTAVSESDGPGTVRLGWALSDLLQLTVCSEMREAISDQKRSLYNCARLKVGWSSGLSALASIQYFMGGHSSTLIIVIVTKNSSLNYLLRLL